MLLPSPRLYGGCRPICDTLLQGEGHVVASMSAAPAAIALAAGWAGRGDVRNLAAGIRPEALRLAGAAESGFPTTALMLVCRGS